MLILSAERALGAQKYMAVRAANTSQHVSEAQHSVVASSQVRRPISHTTQDRQLCEDFWAGCG